MRLLACLPFLLAPLFAAAPAASIASPGAPVSTPNVEGGISRSLHYSPEGTDFVCLNGPEYFNRSLYGNGTAFRLEGGDRPEFALYLPGRGGVLRLGLRSGTGACLWLDQAASISTRYRPGSLLYELADPRLPAQRFQVLVEPAHDRDALLARLSIEGANAGFELIVAFGGPSGERGKRDADIGTEALPLNRWFQLQPAQCKGDRLETSAEGFRLISPRHILSAILPEGAQVAEAAAQAWDNPAALLEAGHAKSDTPVAVALVPIQPGDSTLHLAIGPERLLASGTAASETELDTYKEVHVAEKKTVSSGENKRPETVSPVLSRASLPGLFAAAEAHRRELASHVSVETPDPFLNAAVAALNLAANGVWDQASGTVMHGAVAWRSKLLGWRGPYLNDALGWHDRASSHLFYWSSRQNTSEIPASLPAPEAAARLSRNENALHSNGDLSGSHYDMNLVYIDALFRHLLWTGDRDEARRLWPVITRHLAWERRLFRRSFQPDALPLYEAYCCIWASDDLYYNGGGATHASAYNYYHNLMAARLAVLLGEDPAPYQQEAALIRRGMHRELWLPRTGVFAEWRDTLGYRLAHPSPALWTFYHTVDSLAADPFEAWQMSRFIDTQLAHFPLRGPGLPEDGAYVVPTSNWLPYAWSTNNVVVSEVAHTALGFWQTNRPDEAWKLYKGALLDTMYTGLCPGNAGMCTGFDVARREAQRDFADSVGMLSRALVEGLFGVHPDLLVGELLLSPGLPAAWPAATLHHPDLDFSMQRDDLTTHVIIEQRLHALVPLRLRIPAAREGINRVLVNGVPAVFTALEDSVGRPLVEIRGPAESHVDILVEWSGHPLTHVLAPRVAGIGERLELEAPHAEILDLRDPQDCLSSIQRKSALAAGIVSNNPGHHLLFLQLRQGAFTWWEPVALELRPAYELLASEEQVPGSLRLRLRNNTSSTLKTTAQLACEGQSLPLALELRPGASTEELSLPLGKLPPGSHRVRLLLPAHPESSCLVTNWKSAVTGDAWLPEPLNLDKLLTHRVTDLFKEDYLSPRPQSCSLSIPKQGFGSWCKPALSFEPDDSGLRQASRAGKGQLVLLGDIPFKTPGQEGTPNIALTSLWSQHPHRLEIPLSGKAAHLYLLMTGTTTSMQSRFEVARVQVSYKDGRVETLALRNPETWWPIDADYFTDDYAFRLQAPVPPRLELKSGRFLLRTAAELKGRGGHIPGGAATVLDLPLDSSRELEKLSIIPLANESIFGLFAATLLR